VKKRADGRYQISIMIGYTDEGKPKRKIVYGKTQREAMDKAADIRNKRSMGIVIDNNITLGDWAYTWLNTYKCGVGVGTFRMYQGIIKNHILPSLGHFKLKDVKSTHLQNVVNVLSNRPRAASFFKLTMSQLFNQAIANDIVYKNPTASLRLPSSDSTHRKRALSDDEIAQIHSLTLDSRTRCFINLLLYTGMRRGEALAITKNDIDFVGKTVSVNKALIFYNNKSELKPSPKSDAGIRTIPLLAPLEIILLEYVDTIDSDFLFTSKDGSLTSLISFRRMWGKFEAAYGSKEITPHIFRHNYATMLYNAGVDIKSAQAILGHSSVKMTMDVYTHLSNQNKSDAAIKLTNFLTTKHS
jgi:integrase